MNTTAIFAEILIVGLEGLVWLGLLVAAIFGTGWVEPGELRGWEALTTIGILAAAYALGVLLDRAADTLLRPIDRWLECRLSLRRAPGPAIAEMRLRLMQADDGVSKFLEYQRSRVRVARGTVVNLAFILAATDLFLISRTDVSAKTGGVLGLVIGNIAGLLVVVGVFVAHFGVQRAWLSRLQDAYRMFIDTREGASIEDSGAQSDTSSIVAAVVYRLVGGEPEFLIVRTADGCHWTFPKGHVREAEEPLDGVRREALEEAGVTGQVEAEPLTTYAYPSTRLRDIGDRQVIAYLLKAERTTAAGEGRSARWVSAGGAKRLLRRGRSVRHASEGERVLELARRRMRPEREPQP